MTELTSYGIAMFCATALIICVTPGPDMIYVVANGIQGGVRAGLVAAFGLATGMLVHTLLVVTGLSLFFSSSELVFDIVKLLGASYLLFMAVQTLKARKESLNLDDGGRLPLSKTYQRAIVTNVLNPKVGVFFLAFLPQFVPRGSQSPQADLLVLAIAFLAVGLVVDGVIGFSSGKVRDLLAQDGRVTVAMNTCSGLIFGALGLLQLGALAASRMA